MFLLKISQIESDKTTSIYNVSTRVLSKNKALVERGNQEMNSGNQEMNWATQFFTKGGPVGDPWIWACPQHCIITPHSFSVRCSSHV